MPLTNENLFEFNCHIARAKMQGDYSRAQSTLEHLEAATSQFHHTIEDFIKLHS